MDGGELSVAGAVVGCGYLASYFVARRVCAAKAAEGVWDLADLLFHVPYVPLILILSARALTRLAPLGIEGRWHEATPETRFFLALYVVQVAAHTAVLFMKRHVSSPALYVAHHALSLACYGSALCTGRMHFWAVLDALCEVTNIFLNNVFLCRALGWDKRFPTAYTANGVLLWATYIFFRLVLFPAWLWLFHADVTAHPEATWDRVNWFERYAYTVTTAMLLAISAVWFIGITSGLVNALRKGRKATQAADTARAEIDKRKEL